MTQLTDFLIHDKTAAAVESFLKAPSHAVVLVGPKHLGKSILAVKLAAELLGINEDTVRAYEYIKILDGDEHISVEEIREVTSFLHLKTPGTSVIKRALILIDADRMTTQAQNAFLKTLEEPPADTILLLTSSKIELLTATVKSRLQQLRVIQPDAAQTKAFISEKYPDIRIADRQSALVSSEGRIGRVVQLLDADGYESIVTVNFIRNVLGLSLLEKLLLIETELKDRNAAEDFIRLLGILARYSMRKTIENGKDYRRWYAISSSSHTALLAIRKKGSHKLILTELMLSLR